MACFEEFCDVKAFDTVVRRTFINKLPYPTRSKYHIDLSDTLLNVNAIHTPITPHVVLAHPFLCSIPLYASR